MQKVQNNVWESLQCSNSLCHQGAEELREEWETFAFVCIICAFPVFCHLAFLCLCAAI